MEYKTLPVNFLYRLYLYLNTLCIIFEEEEGSTNMTSMASTQYNLDQRKFDKPHMPAPTIISQAPACTPNAALNPVTRPAPNTTRSPHSGCTHWNPKNYLLLLKRFSLWQCIPPYLTTGKMIPVMNNRSVV